MCACADVRVDDVGCHVGLNTFDHIGLCTCARVGVHSVWRRVHMRMCLSVCPCLCLCACICVYAYT